MRWAICLCVFLSGATSPARAQVRVTSCATLPEGGVEVGANTPFEVVLDRDPSAAVSAWLEFTAFDPDINQEVTLSVNGNAAPPLRNLEWGGDFNNRSASWSAELDRAWLSRGANQLTFVDQDASPFAIERLCVTLEDAPLPTPRPARETFCASDALAPSAFVNNNGNPVDNGEPNIAVQLDVTPSAEAKFGLDVVTFEANGADGDYRMTFTTNGGALEGGFTVAGGADHYVVRTTPEPAALLLEGPNTVEVAMDWTGRIWTACFTVEDEVPVVPDAGPGPPDGGPGPLDAGLGSPDAGGGLDDAGPPQDAGVAPPALDAGPDGGTVDVGQPDGGQGMGTRDAGADAGGPTPGDAGGRPTDGGGEPRMDGGARDAGATPRAPSGLATGDGFQAFGGCGAVGGSAVHPLLGGLVALLMAVRRRRRR